MEKRFEELVENGKRPATELTDEEILYMLKQAAKKEAGLRDPNVTLKLFGTYEDIAHDIYTYLLIKDANGKQGLRWMQNNLTVEHFKNSLFLFVRNEYNGNIRKKKVNNYLFNTNSMDIPIDPNNSSKGYVLDNVVEELDDGYSDLDKMIGYENLLNIFNTIPDVEDETYIIKYKDSTTKLSMRKLAKLMYELYDGIQIRTNNLVDKEVVINKDGTKGFKAVPIIYKLDSSMNGYKEAGKDEISKLISNMKKCLRNNSSFMKIAYEGDV